MTTGAEGVTSRECEYVNAWVCEGLRVCALGYGYVESSEENMTTPRVYPPQLLQGFSSSSSVCLPT